MAVAAFASLRQGRLVSRAIRKRPLSVVSLQRAGDDDANIITNGGSMKKTPPPLSADATRMQKSELLKASSKLSLAPMMEYTDRHFRHLVRLLSSRTLLYTEMVAGNAIVHERKDAIDKLRQDNTVAAKTGAPPVCEYDASYLRRFLGQGMVAPLEGPSVLQLGGSEPDVLAGASRAVVELTERGYCDYTALNLNCGCPSPKVAGKGCFGAALMDDPKLVRDLTTAMHDGCGGAMPVTVKCRIGTDTDMVANGSGGFTVKRYSEMDAEAEYGELCNFIETVASNGIVTDFQVHARIAVLGKSFSPADNRKVPPLKYDYVRRLVQDYPQLSFSLNGGVDTLSGAKEELDECPGLAGVMIGRAWAANPWSFACSDSILYGDKGQGEVLLGYAKPRNRLEVLQMYGKHVDVEEQEHDPVRIRRFMTKAVSSLFAGEPNAKRYRIALDEIGGRPKKLAARGESWKDEPPLSELILDAATKHLSEEVLLRTPEESYEMILWEEQRTKERVALTDTASCSDAGGGDNESGQSIVAEWQQTRKESTEAAA
eukprot:CAMPEP_0178481312 /NCGR_PEP_ID=MMETSP0696-20121128/6147_1 /TAXON_ID=265572 /ORGANISM="Extubocellulus spinifer, Strain CCMP396" /LENGTH=542 /DNA_ID=CAMNT_0020108781 /DNA_START=219 /DNA_END=1847 /DNA_ORIENTATION=+